MSSPYDTIQDYIDKIKTLEKQLELAKDSYCDSCEHYEKAYCENPLSSMQATKPYYSCKFYQRKEG